MNIYLFQRLLGIGALFLQAILVSLIIYLAYRKLTPKRISWLEYFLNNYGAWIVSGLSLMAIIGSLIFSEHYQVEPCKLCWLQRIFVYPQFIIMGIAAWRKDTQAWLSSLWLATTGLIIALYQTNEQLGITSVIPKAECVTGPDAACSQIHMLEFGYITFPLLSAILFALIIVLYFFRKKST